MRIFTLAERNVAPGRTVTDHDCYWHVMSAICLNFHLIATYHDVVYTTGVATDRI